MGRFFQKMTAACAAACRVFHGDQSSLENSQADALETLCRAQAVECERLRVLLDNIQESVILIDPCGEIQTINRAAERMFGYEAREVRGKRVNALLPPEQLGLHEGALSRHIEPESRDVLGIVRAFTGYRKDGSAFPMNVRLHEVVLGGVVWYLGSVIDISAQKEREEVLQQTMERAEAANRTKSDFLANMSHELRTPLNSILGMTQLLLSSSLTEDQKELASVVFISSNNLLKIVNDILDLSKIEAGDERLESIGFDPQKVFAFVLRELSQVANAKGVELNFHNEDGALPYLVGDPLRFKRIVTNLVSNAIKYTPQGQVDVNVSLRLLGTRRVDLRCEVADTGIGIPAEKLACVFDKFVQADSSMTRKFGGTGLGLAITRELVLKMGGQIGVESEEGQGSRFWFMIPFETTDTLSEEKEEEYRAPRCGLTAPGEARILVAEDQVVNQMLIKQLLRRFGVRQAVMVETGAEVLEAFRDGPWTLILMDCYMPDRNGYEATREIRVLEAKTGGHVPILAMTANAMVGDREKCLEAGMDDYVSKPINIKQLKEMMGQWIAFERPDALETKGGDVPG